jgi:hypothetical protein
MRFDGSGNSARPVFRILAALLGFPMLVVGCAQLKYQGWTSAWEFLIPGVGLMLLAIRGKGTFI